MKAGVLFSGGKDSALAALLLSREYEVELNTFVFDAGREIAGAVRAAEALGLPIRRRVFGQELLDEVIAMMVRCGYPNEGINLVHRRAITILCAHYTVVGDGTRMNDRVPMLTSAEVQSLEARSGCSYVRPLLGFGRTEIERLTHRYFDVEYGETDMIENGDYEREIRAAMRIKGIDPSTIFPARHPQSLVVGARTSNSKVMI